MIFSGNHIQFDIQILNDLFTNHVELLRALRASHSEYRLILDCHQPDGIGMVTPRWHNFEMGQAAFHVILWNDAWHHVFVDHFRPQGQEGPWILRIPGPSIIPLLPPSERWAERYRSDGTVQTKSTNSTEKKVSFVCVLRSDAQTDHRFIREAYGRRRVLNLH